MLQLVEGGAILEDLLREASLGMNTREWCDFFWEKRTRVLWGKEQGKPIRP